MVFGEDKKSGGISLPADSMNTLIVQKSLKFFMQNLLFIASKNRELNKGKDQRILQKGMDE